MEVVERIAEAVLQAGRGDVFLGALLAIVTTICIDSWRHHRREKKRRNLEHVVEGYKTDWVAESDNWKLSIYLTNTAEMGAVVRSVKVAYEYNGEDKQVPAKNKKQDNRRGLVIPAFEDMDYVAVLPSGVNTSHLRHLQLEHSEFVTVNRRFSRKQKRIIKNDINRQKTEQGVSTKDSASA